MTSAVSLRQLVVRVLLKYRNQPLGARQVHALLKRHGYDVGVRETALELERLFREGAVRRGRVGNRRAYQIVALPKKKPGTMARLNHIRRTWRESDSCARKNAALRALRDELSELAQRPVRNRSGAAGEKAKAARNRRYRSELENKAEQTRAFCQRADV